MQWLTTEYTERARSVKEIIIDTRELIARTAGKPQRWDGAPSATQSTITPADIAAALAGLPAIHAYYALYVYALDNQARLYCRWHGIVELSRIAHAARWRVGEGLICRLADLALSESIGATVCPVCHGVDLAKASCATCGQTGYKNLSNRARAMQASIPWTSWRREWAARYEQYAYPIYSNLSAEIRRHLDRKLSDI